MSDSYKRWDVCIADVPFEDLPESKPRPVLYLDRENSLDVCIKMTGQAPRAGEYVLMKWQEAGLHKPTTVRIGKRLELEQGRIRKKIGHLDSVDIMNIAKMIK